MGGGGEPHMIGDACSGESLARVDDSEGNNGDNLIMSHDESSSGDSPAQEDVVDASQRTYVSTPAMGGTLTHICIPLPDRDRSSDTIGFSGDPPTDPHVHGGTVLSLGLSGDTPAELGCYTPPGELVGEQMSSPG